MSGLTPPSLSHFTSEICPSLPTAGFKSVSLRPGPALCRHSFTQGPREGSSSVWMRQR